MRHQAKPFVIEVKKSRKPVESSQDGGWFAQVLASTPQGANADKPVSPPSRVLWQPVAEPVAVRRILPDLQHQARRLDVPEQIERTASTPPRKRSPALRKPLGPIEQRLAEIATERRKLLTPAKREALQAARQAIDDLNALGFDYRLVQDKQR